jgi:FkbM family methyltransferase
MSFLKSDGSLVDINFEKVEQELCKKYIPINSSVLELGARYGTVSCVINKILNDPTKQVSVDPDVSIIDALHKNRDANGCKFHIFNGVVSDKDYEISFIDPKFDFAEYGTYTVLSDKPSLNKISLKNLQSKYNITFDCLVADCEGFLPSFINENLWVLDQLKVIIYEKDGTPWNTISPKYDILDKILNNHNFIRVETHPHPLYKNNPNLHNVFIKSI